MIDPALIQGVVDQAQVEIDRLEREAQDAATTTPKAVTLSVGVTLRAHDPETGCLACPLLTDGTCFAAQRHVGRDGVVVAPQWCPIRTGGVMVSSREALRKVVPQ